MSRDTNYPGFVFIRATNEELEPLGSYLLLFLFRVEVQLEEHGGRGWDGRGAQGRGCPLDVEGPAQQVGHAVQELPLQRGLGLRLGLGSAVLR